MTLEEIVQVGILIIMLAIVALLIIFGTVWLLLRIVEVGVLAISDVWWDLKIAWNDTFGMKKRKDDEE